MTHFDPQLGFVSENLPTWQDEKAELQLQVDTLQESWDQAAAALLRLRTEDEGWQLLGQVRSQEGFSLQVIKEVAVKAEIQTVGNPLLKQGFALRFNPIFSRGFELATTDGKKLEPRFQRKLDNLTVKQMLFTEEGHEDSEKALFNVGNLFVAYNKATGNILRIPFEQIMDRAVDPDNPAQTAYYLRNWTRNTFDGKTENINEWYPTVEWLNTPHPANLDMPTEIANHPVNDNWVVVDMRVNVPTVGHWGIPDCFPSLPYAWAYSEYIRDSASLLKALATIAWKVVGKSKTQAQTAGVQLSQAKKVAGTAAMTAGTELAAMPKAGQVDMADGVALAAMAASGMGVPVGALANIVVGGQAPVQALDAATVAMARARQKRWTDFYERLFLAMGIKDLTVNFPKITEDPIHRQVSSLSTSRAMGGLWADEYRAAVLEAQSVKPLHDEAPPVEEYAQAHNALGFLNLMEAEIAKDEAENDPQARQGNVGVAGKLGEIDNTNRDQDVKAGSGTQTDLVG